MDDYNPLDEYPENGSCREEEWFGKHLIIVNRAKDVSITGPGTVDGNGGAFFCEPRVLNWTNAWREGLRLAADKEKRRPGQLIVFILSEDVRVSDLAIRNTPCWSIFFHGCVNVQVRGLNVRNGRADANTDGLDIDCCRNVTVSGCVIDTGDDAIAIRGDEAKLPAPKACENVVVSDCVLASSSSGLRIGVGTGTIRNVELSNLIVSRAGTGVTVQSSFTQGKPVGVDISFVRIHHCSFLECGVLFSICPGDAGAEASIHDISFQDCRFEGFGSGLVAGSGTHRPENISFRDCDFVMTANPDPARFEVGTDFLRVDGSDFVSFRSCRVRNEAGPDDPRRIILAAQSSPGLCVEACNFSETGIGDGNGGAEA